MGARQAVWLFIALPSHLGRLSLSYKFYSRDIEAGFQRKRWRHWDGRGASHFRVAGRGEDILLVRCVEKVSYQPQLTTFMETWWRDKAVPTASKVAFSCLGEDWSLL